MQSPLWQPRSGLAARLLGASFGAVGLALLYWQVYGPLRRMAAGELHVTYSLTLILFGEMFVVLGTIWLFGGLAGYEAVQNFQRRPGARRIIIAMTVVVGGLSWWIMQSQVASYGYENR